MHTEWVIHLIYVHCMVEIIIVIIYLLSVPVCSNVSGILNPQFLAPAVTVGERRELWILPPFFLPLLLPITL